MSKDTTESWLKFLNPESLKKSLIQASIYLACWETLKNTVMDHPRGFYTNTWKDGEGIPDPGYKSDVLALDTDPLIASAMWFRNQDAISDDDITLLRAFRKHRNEIAHELPKFIGTVGASVQMEFFDGMLYLVAKIDKWWIQNYEIPLNPDFDNRKLTQDELDGVKSMSMMLMDVLLPVAKGDEDRLRSIYEGMKAHIEKEKAAAPPVANRQSI